MSAADEIRARYIEVIARRFYELDADDQAAVSDVEIPPWPQANKAGMTHSVRADAQSAVDALAAAGLLPTGQEWGARVLSGPHAGKVIVAGESETAVRAHAAGARNAEIVHHYTHDWREAPDV